MADAEDEEADIRHYFSLNLEYDTIMSSIERISKGTLLNRLKKYGLQRRDRIVDVGIVREHIIRELDGSGSLLGYRSMWRMLHSNYGINVPRPTVHILQPIAIKGDNIPTLGRTIAGTLMVMTKLSRTGSQYTGASMDSADK